MSNKIEKIKEDTASLLIQRTSEIRDAYYEMPLIEKTIQLQEMPLNERKLFKSSLYLIAYIFRLVQLGEVKKAIKYYLILKKVHHKVLQI